MYLINFIPEMFHAPYIWYLRYYYMIFVFFRFIVTDDAQEYKYNIGICTNAVIDETFGANVGVVQNRIKPAEEGVESHNHWIIGYYNQSQLIDGSMYW